MCGEPAAYAAALAELAAWRSRETRAGGRCGRWIAPRASAQAAARASEDDEPRPVSGLAVLAVGLIVSAGRRRALRRRRSRSAGSPRADGAADRWSRPDRSEGTGAYARRITLKSTTRRTWTCTPSVSAQEAERAYERVSSDLRHNLAFRVPIVLFRTTSELEQSVQAATSGRPHVASSPSLPATASCSRGPAGRSVVRAHHPRGRARLRVRHPSWRRDAAVDHGRSGRVRTRRLGSERSGRRCATRFAPTRSRR